MEVVSTSVEAVSEPFLRGFGLGERAGRLRSRIRRVDLSAVGPHQQNPLGAAVRRVLIWADENLKVPIREDLCWQVLRLAASESVLSSWLKGASSNDPPLKHAIPLFVLERELVLEHSKSDIEDSVYFLEKRGYLVRHGFHGLTRVAYQLTAAGLDALDLGSFKPEEQAALGDALLDVRRPEIWGLKFNLEEAWRRLRKRVSGRPTKKLGEGKDE